MIQIVIKKTSVQKSTHKENLLVKKTPTEIVEPSSYGGRSERAYQQEFAVVEVERSQEIEQVLLRQEMSDDALDLAAVIKAVNRIE